MRCALAVNSHGGSSPLLAPPEKDDVAHRYGSIERKTKNAYTHIEYDEAERLKIPVLEFVIDRLPAGTFCGPP